MKLIANPKTNSLVEVMQGNDVKFAFAKQNADGDFQLLHTWMKCREYFNELLMKNNHPSEFSFDNVHGFVYDYNQFPMELNQTVFAMKFPNTTTYNNVKNNISYLHKIEDYHNIDRTQVLEPTDKNCLLIIGSKFWQQKCLLLNVYTWLLKCISLGTSVDKPLEALCTELKDHYALKEVSYYHSIGASKVERLLQSLPMIVEFPTKYVDGSETIRGPYGVHGNSGMLTFHRWDDSHSSSTNPEWLAVKQFGEFMYNMFKSHKKLTYQFVKASS